MIAMATINGELANIRVTADNLAAVRGCHVAQSRFLWDVMTHQRCGIVGHTLGWPPAAAVSLPGDDPPAEMHAHSQHCTRFRENCRGHFSTTAVSGMTTVCDETDIRSPSYGGHLKLLLFVLSSYNQQLFSDQKSHKWLFRYNIK